MRTVIVLLSGFFLLALAANGCETSQPTQPSAAEVLLGTWEETFEWKDLIGGIEPSSDVRSAATTKTSTLSFARNTFRITILPPHRVFVSLPDTSYTAPSPDTLYSGSWSVEGDTLRLFGGRFDQRYWIILCPDSVEIGVLAEADTSGYMTMRLTDFLWGHSRSKWAGMFRRVNGGTADM